VEQDEFTDDLAAVVANTIREQETHTTGIHWTEFEVICENLQLDTSTEKAKLN
jgi:hypothetical protein